MAFKFPFTNYHELNLTWVLEQLKKLFEESNENVETIENYEDRLSAVETELPVVEATADQAATVANAAATLAQTAKTTADTANENALTASAQAGLARQEAATAEAEAQAATQAAQQAQATAQNFDGRITQAEEDASEALQEAQSFENRVDAAINTANNAANTATIAQGIAVNANQNAATALDTAQTADGKAEAAQDAAEVADGKAEAAQDAADIADGKAEAAQDAAEVADGKAEAAQDAAEVADGKAEAAQDTADTNATNIGNLANLTTTAKNNLVAAINEAAQSGGGGVSSYKSVGAYILQKILCPDFEVTYTGRKYTKKGNHIFKTLVSSSASNRTLVLTGPNYVINAEYPGNFDLPSENKIPITVIRSINCDCFVRINNINNNTTASSFVSLIVSYFDTDGNYISGRDQSRLLSGRNGVTGNSLIKLSIPDNAVYFAISIRDSSAAVTCDFCFDLDFISTALTESIAPIENGTTASKAYAQGSYFFHNDKFCKAITAIARGATFTLNTNYSETTVAAELLAAQN